MMTAPVAMTERTPMLMSIQNPKRVLNILRSPILTSRVVGMGRTIRRAGAASMVSGEMIVAVMPQLLRVGCRPGATGTCPRAPRPGPGPGGVAVGAARAVPCERAGDPGLLEGVREVAR